jgi:hypothetical protein
MWYSRQPFHVIEKLMCVAMQNALHLSTNEVSLEEKTSHANVMFSRILCYTKTWYIVESKAMCSRLRDNLLV